MVNVHGEALIKIVEQVQPLCIAGGCTEASAAVVKMWRVAFPSLLDSSTRVVRGTLVSPTTFFSASHVIAQLGLPGGWAWLVDVTWNANAAEWGVEVLSDGAVAKIAVKRITTHLKPPLRMMWGKFAFFEAVPDPASTRGGLTATSTHQRVKQVGGQALVSTRACEKTDRELIEGGSGDVGGEL